jgi:hypothetical protein
MTRRNSRLDGCADAPYMSPMLPQPPDRPARIVVAKRSAAPVRTVQAAVASRPDAALRTGLRV